MGTGGRSTEAWGELQGEAGVRHRVGRRMSRVGSRGPGATAAWREALDTIFNVGALWHCR